MHLYRRFPAAVTNLYIFYTNFLFRLFQSSVSVSEAADERRASLVGGPSDTPPLCRNPFIDFPIEHPIHYNVAEHLAFVLRRGLAERLAELTLRFRCPRSESPYATRVDGSQGEGQETESGNSCHPLKECPPLCWTDSQAVQSSMKPFLGLVLSIGAAVDSCGSLDNPIWRQVDRGVPASSPLARHYK